MADRPACLLAPARLVLLGLLTFLVGQAAPTARLLASELRETPIVRAVQRVRASVVNIRGEKTVAVPVTQVSKVDAGRRVNGMGTGVIVDPRGYILTNHHVVDGVREIQVTLDTQERYVARLVARDPETDLAIVKIDAPDTLPVIPLGTSADLMPGETVIALGNAYGYDHTVTRGIVSALHREVQVSEAQYYGDLIQTDASINPGNSGGPLLNIDGDMIGINVAVRAGAQGIGFAIPVDKALMVAADLLAQENSRQSYHGIVPREQDAAARLVVESVEPESPAATAGLKAGDVITAVESKPVSRPIEFHRALLEEKPGEEVELAVSRGGESVDLKLTLAGAQISAPAASGIYWDTLGMDLRPLSAEQFRQQFQTRYRGGVSVVAIRPDGPAAAQGIRRGDVLVGMHLWETVSLANVDYILNRPDFSTLSPVKFFILRGSDTLYGFLPVGVTKTAQR